MSCSIPGRCHLQQHSGLINLVMMFSEQVQEVENYGVHDVSGSQEKGVLQMDPEQSLLQGSKALLAAESVVHASASAAVSLFCIACSNSCKYQLQVRATGLDKVQQHFVA